MPHPRIYLHCAQTQLHCHAGSRFRFQRSADDALGWVVTIIHMRNSVSRYSTVYINGHRVRELRRKLGLSQKDLSSLLTQSLSSGYISSIEKSSNARVSCTTAEGLGAALGVNIDDLSLAPNPIEIAHKYFEAWNCHDSIAIVHLFTKDGTYSDPLEPSGLRGAQIADYATELFTAFPDLTCEVLNIAPVRNGTLAVQWRLRGTHTGPLKDNPGTGRPIDLAAADFIKFEGMRIRSVEGYFDQKAFMEQLGLQVIAQPYSRDGHTFGWSHRLASGKRTKPGAVSVTWIEAWSDEEKEEVKKRALEILDEIQKTPGFISHVGIVVGPRLCTITAWKDVDSVRAVHQSRAHKEAMERVFSTNFCAAIHTAVYVPHHLNSMRVRCTHCHKMQAVEELGGKCECGQPLLHPAYW